MKESRVKQSQTYARWAARARPEQGKDRAGSGSWRHQGCAWGWAGGTERERESSREGSRQAQARTAR